MKISKFKMAMVGLSITAGMFSSSVFAMSADEALNKLGSLKEQVEGAKEYMASKDYDKLPGKLHDAVKHACKEGCNRFTCRKGPVKSACKMICPENDIKNCSKA